MPAGAAGSRVVPGGANARQEAGTGGGVFLDSRARIITATLPGGAS
jgi:hypothetical protein